MNYPDHEPEGLVREWTCPVCGKHEIQEHWKVSSVAPARYETQEDGTVLVLEVDYDASKMIWDDVEHEVYPFECRCCCYPVKEARFVPGVEG